MRAASLLLASLLGLVACDGETMLWAPKTVPVDPGPLHQKSYGEPKAPRTVKEQFELAGHDDGQVLVEVEAQIGTDPVYLMEQAGPVPAQTPNPFGKVSLRLVKNDVAKLAKCTLEDELVRDLHNRWIVHFECEYATKNTGGSYVVSLLHDGTLENLMYH